MTADSLGNKEKAFEDRLASFGLQLNALNVEMLRIGGKSTVRLDAVGRGVAPTRWIRPSSWPEMKEWVGVPQSAVSKRAGEFIGRRTGRLPVSKHIPQDVAPRASDEEVKPCNGCADPGRKQSSAISRSVICQYLYGDAREPAVMDAFRDLELAYEFPIWLYNRVHVEPGGVLEFGPGMNLLTVDTLVIEPGGKIQSAGNLKISCRRITRS